MQTQLFIDGILSEVHVSEGTRPESTEEVVSSGRDQTLPLPLEFEEAA